MNLLTTNQPLTMSSREIAEYTEKKHQHVKRDICIMLMQLELDSSKYGRNYKDSLNRNQVELEQVGDISETVRGSGGFGSTN